MPAVAQADAGCVSPCGLAGAGRTIARIAGPLLPARFNVRRAGEVRFAKLARIVGSTSLDHMYRQLCSIDDDPAQTIMCAVRRPAAGQSDEMDRVRATLDPLDRMDACGFLSYLTDDILQKVESGGDGRCA